MLHSPLAQHLLVGFHGTGLGDDLKRLLDAGVLGVIWFKRNIQTAEQVAEVNRQIRAYASRPLMISVDQEGGRVARLRAPSFASLPSMRSLGESADLSHIQDIGRMLGKELRAVGFNWDFAPVLDVDTNPDNPVIGDRSFSRDPERVAACGLALAQGLESAGVASCGKHFPGHGDTAQDSHLELPTLSHSLDRLESIEWKPFMAYAGAKLSSIMTAHVVFEALDPGVPATLSKIALTECLRNRLGFSGVVVSDDLEMKAISKAMPVPDAAIRSLSAGADVLLVCQTDTLQWETLQALDAAAKSGRLSEALLRASQTRIEALLARFGRASGTDEFAWLSSEDHRRWVDGFQTAAGAAFDPTERV